MAGVVATPFVAIGTPLWAIGHNKQQAAATFGPTEVVVVPVAQGRPGLTLAGRF